MSLEVIKKGKDEELMAIKLPLTGKMTTEDLAAVLNISLPSLIAVIKKKSVKIHKVSDRLSSKWIVDLESFWQKT